MVKTSDTDLCTFQTRVESIDIMEWSYGGGLTSLCIYRGKIPVIQMPTLLATFALTVQVSWESRRKDFDNRYASSTIMSV